MKQVGKKSGRRMWAWLLSDTLASLFVIQDRRNAQAAQSLIHEFAGTLVTDRCPSYIKYDGKRQWCWAHLIRDFEHLALFDDIEGDIGRGLLDASHRMFHDYHRWRDGSIARATFVTYARRLQREMTPRLDDGIAFGSDRFAGQCKALRSGWDMAWTFLSDEEIPPTNNLAEQSLRPLVIARKISYGNQSDIGCRFTERIMTVVTSCRKQSRNVFEFLRQVFCAPSEGRERPRLVPNP
jgi:transposase